MAQAIKQFNGTTYGSFATQQDTVYTCPSNTVAIVLPNCLFIPTYAGGSGGLGYNSSTLSAYGDNNGQGNYIITGGDTNFAYQISHDDKHRVRIALMNQNTDSFLYWSPNWTTNLKNSSYGLHENREPWTNSTYGPHYSALVAGAIERAPNSNAAFAAKDFVAGTWVMGAGHKLTINALTMRVQWSFLIIEEAA